MFNNLIDTVYVNTANSVWSLLFVDCRAVIYNCYLCVIQSLVESFAIDNHTTVPQ